MNEILDIESTMHNDFTDRSQTALAELNATEHQINYAYSGWCQTALPHRQLTNPEDVWQIQTDNMTLLVEPGLKIDAEGNPVRVGIPYGSISRLILIYLQSEALRTQQRNVHLGNSLREFLRRLGIAAGGKTSRIVQNQADRISRCRFTFHSTTLGRAILFNQNIVDIAMLTDATESDGQRNMFVETVRLGEVFFEQLQNHAVPLDENAIRSLRQSSMALDIYCWSAYRLHALKKPVAISWTALSQQFGIGIEKRKHFKPTFITNLKLAMKAYENANIEITPTGVILNHSKPPVAKLQITTSAVAKVHTKTRSTNRQTASNHEGHNKSRGA